MFRFTIRELVLLTLVVAMGVGWWLEHQRFTSTAQMLSSAADVWKNKADSAEWIINQLKARVRREGDGSTVSDVSVRPSLSLPTPEPAPRQTASPLP